MVEKIGGWDHWSWGENNDNHDDDDDHDNPGVGRTIGWSGLGGPETPRQEDSTFRIIIQIIINHIFNIGFS